jgi:hypothetical protein
MSTVIEDYLLEVGTRFGRLGHFRVTDDIDRIDADEASRMKFSAGEVA